MSKVKLKADFWDVWCLFNGKMDEARALQKSESSNGVKYSENDIKQFSQLLQKFVKVSWESGDVQRFLDSIVKYFWLIIRFAEQFKQSPSNRHYFVVRMALDAFLFVTTRLKLYTDIMLKFVKLVDKIVMDFGHIACTKEFLRLYAALLSDVRTPENLISKHKCLPALYKLAKKSDDIDTQAIIIEVILKLFNFDPDHPKLRTIFPEISDLPDIQGNNVYQYIRMVLDVLNKDSSNIFSVYCTEITLDHKTVTEYDESDSVHDTWLDINVPAKIMSFFCTKDFFTSFSNRKFDTFTSWGVLSFRVENVLRSEFFYDRPRRSLIITLKIKSSSFNLFGESKFDVIRSLKITVSKDSEKYEKLVSLVLPNLFENFPASELFKCNVEMTDDDATPDDLTEPDFTSPVLGECEKKQIGIVEEPKAPCIYETVPTIIIDDDNNNNDEHINTSQRKISTYSPSEPPKSLKISSRDETATCSKSITPISFTDSMFGISRKPKKFSTSINARERTSEDSSEDAIAEETSRKMVKTVKISTVLSKIFKKTKVPPQTQPRVTAEADAVPEVVGSTLPRDNEHNYSASKVEDWLKTLPDKSSSDVEAITSLKQTTAAPPEPLGSGLEDLRNFIEKGGDVDGPIDNRPTGLSQRSKSSIHTDTLIEILGKDLNHGNAGARVIEQKSPIKGTGDEEEKTDLDKTTPDTIESDVPLSELVKKKSEKKKEADIPVSLRDIEQSSVMACVPRETKNEKKETREPKDTLNCTINVSQESLKIDPPREQRLSLNSLNTSQPLLGEINENNEESVLNKTQYLSPPNETMNKKALSPPNETMNKKANSSSSNDMPLQPVSPVVKVVQYNETSDDSESQTEKIKKQKRLTHLQKRKEPQLAKQAVQERDKNKNVTSMKRKRALYNPGDCSFLEETLTDAFMQEIKKDTLVSEEPKEKRKRGRPRKTSESSTSVPEEPKEKRKRGRPRKSGDSSKQTDTKQAHRKKGHQRKESRSSVDKKKEIGTKETSLTFDKAFESLKQKVKEEKKVGKMQKKVEKLKKGKKNGAFLLLSSPSSPSSLEPFGQGYRNLTDKRKRDSSDESPFSRLLREEDHKIKSFRDDKRSSKRETGSSNEGDVMEDRGHGEYSTGQGKRDKKNINIISNVLVKIAENEKERPAKESNRGNAKKETKCFCRTYLTMLKIDFLEFYKHAENCDLVASERQDLSKVFNVLKRY